MKVEIYLNGANYNPFEKMGLRQNPFPAIPKAEYEGANQLIADLHARPIKDEAELRQRLNGCSAEFIDMACKVFEPGKITRFLLELDLP